MDSVRPLTQGLSKIGARGGNIFALALTSTIQSVFLFANCFRTPVDGPWCESIVAELRRRNCSKGFKPHAPSPINSHIGGTSILPDDIASPFERVPA